MTVTPNLLPTCNITFSTTTTVNPQATLGSALGTLYYKGASTGCPIDTCATAGWYYLSDASGGLALVSRSTNTSDECPIILGRFGAGTTVNGGTYSGAYIANNQYPGFILPTGTGLTGARWWSAGSSATTWCEVTHAPTPRPGLTLCTPSLFRFLPRGRRHLLLRRQQLDHRLQRRHRRRYRRQQRLVRRGRETTHESRKLEREGFNPSLEGRVWH